MRHVVNFPTQRTSDLQRPLDHAANYGSSVRTIARRYLPRLFRTGGGFGASRRGNARTGVEGRNSIPIMLSTIPDDSQNNDQPYELIRNPQEGAFMKRSHLASKTCNESQRLTILLALIEVQAWSEASDARIAVYPRHLSDGLNLAKTFGGISKTTIDILRRRYQSIVSEVERPEAGRVSLKCATASWSRCQHRGRRLMIDTQTLFNTNVLMLCPRFFGHEYDFRTSVFIRQLTRMHLDDLPGLSPTPGPPPSQIMDAAVYGEFSRGKYGPSGRYCLKPETTAFANDEA